MTDQELRGMVVSLLESQRETDRQIKETDRLLRERQEELDRLLKESARDRRETDRLEKERKEEADRLEKERKKEAARRQEEADRLERKRREEADREERARRKQAEREMGELRQKLGRLDDKFGSYTEGLALPSMTKILTQRFHMDVVAARVLVRRNGRSLEVDVLAYSNAGVDEVYVVEVKSHLRMEAIVQIKRTLREIHEFFPAHRGKKVYGILAAVDAPENVRRRALQEGIYLARIHDGQFELEVPEGFQPRGF